MPTYKDFETWWSEYCVVSALNKVNLSFLDVGILKEEMRLAFLRRMPTEAEIENTLIRIKRQG